MTELKPYPFCGGEAVSMRGVYQLVFIKCKNKHCGAVVSFDNSLTNYLPKRAYEQYNRRAVEGNG